MNTQLKDIGFTEDTDIINKELNTKFGFFEQLYPEVDNIFKWSRPEPVQSLVVTADCQTKVTTRLNLAGAFYELITALTGQKPTIALKYDALRITFGTESYKVRLKTLSHSDIIKMSIRFTTNKFLSIGSLNDYTPVESPIVAQAQAPENVTQDTTYKAPCIVDGIPDCGTAVKKHSVMEMLQNFSASAVSTCQSQKESTKDVTESVISDLRTRISLSLKAYNPDIEDMLDSKNYKSKDQEFATLVILDCIREINREVFVEFGDKVKVKVWTKSNTAVLVAEDGSLSDQAGNVIYPYDVIEHFLDSSGKSSLPISKSKNTDIDGHDLALSDLATLEAVGVL